MIWIDFWANYWTAVLTKAPRPTVTTPTPIPPPEPDTATIISLDDYRTKRKAR